MFFLFFFNRSSLSSYCTSLDLAISILVALSFLAIAATTALLSRNPSITSYTPTFWFFISILRLLFEFFYNRRFMCWTRIKSFQIKSTILSHFWFLWRFVGSLWFNLVICLSLSVCKTGHSVYILDKSHLGLAWSSWCNLDVIYLLYRHRDIAIDVWFWWFVRLLAFWVLDSRSLSWWKGSSVTTGYFGKCSFR